MKITVACLLSLMLCTPAHAQKSEERQTTEKKATLAFWTGIGVASAGITPLIAGSAKVGMPFFAAGGGLIYYGIHLNNKAKQMPSTTFTVVPTRKGLALAINRSW